MLVREFISLIQEALDKAVARSTKSKEIIIVFRAPNSGFCGPTIRPKFLGAAEPFAAAEMPGDARYGLTRLQVEQLLEAFDVTLPVKIGTV